MAPFAFVLADPRVTLLDPRELQSLAQELHIKLFGQESDGDVTLLTLEGDQAEVMRFASATRREIQALLNGEIEGMSSRVCKITRDGVTSIAPVGGSIMGSPPYETLAPTNGRTPAGAMFRGIYHLPREQFLGSALIWQEGDDAPRTGELCLAEGVTAEHDTLGIAAAPEALKAQGAGRIFLPVSFSTLIKTSGRAALAESLAKLPRETRPRVSASVYDTPRAPSFQALTQMRRILDPHFLSIDLRVTDPAFAIDQLAGDMARSVTLTLPEGDEKQRLNAIIRFMNEAPAYNRKRILQGICDLRSRRELQMCIRYGAPFLSGPAISELYPDPVGDIRCPRAALPLRNVQKAA